MSEEDTLAPVMYSERIWAAVSPAMYDDIAQTAARIGMKKSEFIRVAIQEYINRYNKEREVNA